MKLLFMAACALAIVPGGDAATLWTNGAVNTTFSADNRCDTGPNLCAAAHGASWTIFDNFNVPSGSNPWLVSGFDFTDFFVDGTSSDIGSTTWEIFRGDPLSSGQLVASGTATAVASLVSGTCSATTTCIEKFTVTLASAVTLTAGSTYYLGTSTTLTPSISGEALLRAFAAGGNTAPGGTVNSLGQWELSNGSTSGVVGSAWTAGTANTTFPSLGINETATAFDIFGTLQTTAPVPEPGSLILGGIALCGMCLLRRIAA